MRLWPPLISDGGSLTFIITAILWKRKKNYACHDPSPPSIAVRARRSLTKLKVMYDLFSYTGFRLAVGLANCSVDFCIDYTDILQNFHVVVALGTTSGSQPAVVPAHWSSCTASHASKFNEHYHAIPVMERAPVRFFPRRKADTTIHSSRSPRRALRKVGPSSGRAHLCRNPSDSPSKCHGFFFSSDHNKWRAQIWRRDSHEGEFKHEELVAEKVIQNMIHESRACRVLGDGLPACLAPRWMREPCRYRRGQEDPSKTPA